MSTVTEQKAALRRQVQTAVRRITAAERAQSSEWLLARLRRQPQWRAARSVLLFAPLADEPDIGPLISEAFADGKLVALPRFESAGVGYRAALIGSLGELSAPAAFGVREPTAGCPELPLSQLDFALVPGVAFDAFGSRLGRGKGFYDRLLTVVTGVKCGVAFDSQVVATLPREPHDVTLNCLVTPTRWLDFPPAPRPDGR
ncbi:MAG: 5-formyltetrahydrofolate cyclo-ligase [Verrucomicrobia bacterium]|nr:5-formyltetrahydrofolate cyclo-ligase [Verrucomicrobiota bacterium]